MTELPTLLFATQADWEAWLEKEASSSQGVWLKIAKKGSSQSSVSLQEALDIALCFGWIDGQSNKLDEDFYLQRYTPRRKQSPWSKINVEKVAKLIEAGRMREAGLKEIERAKADGRWDRAYDPPSKATIPDDLQAAFDANPELFELYKTLNSQNRYAILYSLQTAKKPETREKRLREFIAKLAEKKRLD